MGDRVCLVGFGRIGEVVGELISREGLGGSVLVYDASEKRVSLARERGFEAHLADTTSDYVAERIAQECSVAITALPSRRAEAVLRTLIRHRVDAIVDVSYIEDPLALREPSRRYGVRLFVDTGVAPGLSNILAARLYWSYGAREITVYVGGVSEEPREPLGLVASWNMADMLEEYVRPARAKIKGRIVRLDPLSNTVKVEVPGIGVFEAIPTDGLRTLIETLEGAETLIEYTLRYPGHVGKMLFLKSLGLLDTTYKSVEGQAVKPLMLLARLLEEKLPKKGDRIVLYVRGKRDGVERAYAMDYRQSELGISGPVLGYVTGLVQSWFALKALEGVGRRGLNKPELVAKNDRLYDDLLRFLAKHSVKLLEIL